MCDTYHTWRVPAEAVVIRPHPAEVKLHSTVGFTFLRAVLVHSTMGVMCRFWVMRGRSRACNAHLQHVHGKGTDLAFLCHVSLCKRIDPAGVLS